MQTKLFEIRDSATCISAIGIRVSLAEAHSPKERWLLQRAGYDSVLILFGNASGGEFTYDPYDWANQRTWGVAHRYVMEHWYGLQSGDMIDVQALIGLEPMETDFMASDYPGGPP